MSRLSSRISKEQRHIQLKQMINDNPFITDEELAKNFRVSIQTIRLDRIELRIPELRERTKMVAEQVFNKVRSVSGHEFVGELIDLELGQYATSVLDVVPEMVSENSQVCRGDYLFSQANTLAVALIDADIVLTGSARLRFRRPVYLNEKIVAHAFLARKKINKYLVKVVAKVGTEEVFVAKFVLVAR